MSRIEQAPRIATVCVLGPPLKQVRQNPSHLALLAKVVSEINQHYAQLDAVVFPGGFLRLDETVGPLPFASRVQVLKNTGLVKPLTKAVKTLTRSHGVQVILGIDGPRYPRGDSPDHLCVALDEYGITGLSRRSFPVADGEAKHMLCYDADFRDPRRVIELASGRQAMLAACYDLFGIGDGGAVVDKRARHIQWIGDHKHRLRRGENGFRERLEANLAAFLELLATVTTGVAAIHEFKTSRSSFWQRHGIASCSATLDNGFAVGAAHFSHQLPQQSHTSTLAAAYVPTKHLTQGLNRKAHSWLPRDHFVVDCDHGAALVRIFD
jgi:hypothetical protein